MLSQKKRKKLYRRNAAKATNLFRDLGATKWTIHGHRQYQDAKLGKLGAASECRVLIKDGKPPVADEDEQPPWV